MKILVGLGNPGSKYEKNRHNVGFMALDAIAGRYGAGAWRKRFQGVTAEIDIDRVRYMLLKPETYMNESGRAVSEAMRFYKMSPADVIVFHDEIDLEPGKLRVKFGGGHAGHNGLRSISAHIGNDYQRVRIGVGHPGSKDAVVHYVLHDFARADEGWLNPLLDGIAQGLPALVTGQDAKFLNDVVRLARPIKAKDEPRKAERAAADPAPTPRQAPAPNPTPAPKPVERPAPRAEAKKPEPAMAGADARNNEPQTSLGAKLVAWLRRS
jgi:PTH1 family peptidyl-tRNA hydrolase